MESSSSKKNDSEKEVTGYLQETVKGEAGRIYHLYDTKVRIGRNVKSEIPICGPNISRNHALLNYTKKGWTVTDENSTIGVYINCQKLEPGKSHLLKSGHTIFIGPPENADYVYTYHSYNSTKVKKSAAEKKMENQDTSHDSPTKTARKTRSKKKRASQIEVECDSNSSSPKKTCIDVEKSLEEQLATLKSKLKEHDEIEQRIKRKLNESDSKIDEEILENLHQSDDTCSLRDSESLLPVDNNSTPASEQTIDSQPYSWDFPVGDDIFSYVSTQQLIDGETAESKKLTELEMQLAALQKQLNDKEKTRIELLKKLEEKETVLKEQEEEKKQFETKVKEELETLTKETKSLDQRVKTEVANEFGSVIESEFMCSICTELFVKATTLSCSHTFCAKCISVWKKSKKQCPICRVPISGEMRSVVIDSLIDKLVEKSAPEFQERRKAVLKEHEMEAKKKKTPPKRGKRRRGGASNRNNSRSTASNRNFSSYFGGDQMYLSNLLDFPVSVITGLFTNVSDEEDTDSLEDDYYDGNGRCYNCGRAGHWANSCPDGY